MGKVKLVCQAAGFLIRNLGKLKKMEKLKAEGKQQEKNALLSETLDRLCAEGLQWTKMELEIEGAENIPDETAVFVPNHQSGIHDALIMLNVVKNHRPCGFLMKKSLESIPLVGDWVRMVDCIFVDRENPREGVRALNEAAEQLENGVSMIIFPEGTRTKNYPVLSEFKNGAFKIAQKAKTPLVPVVIFDSGIRLEASADGKLTGGTVHVKILPPIHIEGMDRKEYKNIGQTVHDLIEAEMKAFYGDNYRVPQA